MLSSTTQLLEGTTDSSRIKSVKKQSDIDRMDFAVLLNSQTTTDSTRQNQNETSTTNTNSADDRELTAGENKTNTSTSSDTSTADENNDYSSDEATTHSRKDGRAEADQDSTPTSDSGTEGTSDSAMSVDGRENGIQPGASTEAAVNAQTLSSSVTTPATADASDAQASDAAAATATTASTTETNSSDLTDLGGDNLAALTNSDDFQNLIRQIMSETDSSSSDPQDQSTADDVKITATTIEKNTHLLQGNLNSNNQNIMFDTGLAEHFVRLLTDQFDQLKSTTDKTDSATSNNSSSQNAQTPTMTPTSTAGLTPGTTNASYADVSKTAANSLFSESQTPLTQDTDASSNLDRVVQVVRSNLGQRQSQITVRLDPPDLGKMKVDIKLVDNNLNLSIITETPEAAKTLSARMDTLRQNLEQSGISLAKVEVVTQTNNSQAGQNQNWQQDGQSSSQNGFSFQQQQQNQSQNQSSETFITSGNEATDSISDVNVNGANTLVNLVA
jgi:flagellar hook-length control protein FliK